MRTSSSRPQPPQQQLQQTNSSYRQQQQQQQQSQPQRPLAQQQQQYTRYAAPPSAPQPPSSQSRYAQSRPPPQPASPYYEEAEEDEQQHQQQLHYSEQVNVGQPQYDDAEYEQQQQEEQQHGGYGDYAQHEVQPHHSHAHPHEQQHYDDGDGPSQQELYDYDQQQQYAEHDDQQHPHEQQHDDQQYYDEQDEQQHHAEHAGGDEEYDEQQQQYDAQPADDDQQMDAQLGFSQQPQPHPASAPPPAGLHPVAESEHEPASPPARPFHAAAAAASVTSPMSPDLSAAALSPSSPPFSASLPITVTVSEEEQPVYDDVVDAVLVLLRRAEGGGAAAVDEGEEAQWLSDARQEYSAFSSSPSAAFLPFASSLLSADKLSLFARLLSAASESLQVAASCASLRVELEAELQRETDLTLLSASLLQPDTRPGLCCLRFTPAAIPPSFHDALTLSLLAELQQRQPDLYRRGELRTANKDGAEGADSACVVVEASRLAVARGAAALASELRRCSARVRLPEQAERQLSEHLKRGISQAESALKRGGSGGLGVSVIRSLPIVGSVFSFFAGSAGKKGHSYNMSSSYDGGKQSKDKAAAGPKTAATAPPPAAAASSAPARPADSRAASAKADGKAAAPPQQQQLQEQEEESNGQAEAEPAAALSSDSDLLFEQLSARDPADLLRVMTEGSVVTCFFPSNPSDPSDVSASAVPLYLFFDEQSESLCWCEAWPPLRLAGAEPAHRSHRRAAPRQ